MAWFDELLPAKFKGIPFGVRSSRSRFGRRNAVHEYPFRDTPWVEDLGRASRGISMIGFIVGDDAIAQRDSLVAMAESNDSGLLIHPTLGGLKVSLLDLEVEESWDHGRVFMLHFNFMEAGDHIFAKASVSTSAVTQQAALAAYTQTAIEYAAKVRGYYNRGAAVVRQVQLTADTWVRQVQSVADDATNIYNAVTSLPGALQGLFGRFFGAHLRTGAFLSTSATATVVSLQAQATVARASVQSAGTGLTISASGDDSDAISNSVLQIVTSVQTASVDPADAIRVLLDLLVLSVPRLASTGAIGMAANAAASTTGDLIVRYTAISLVQAVIAYQPSSYDDAAALRARICGVLDGLIDIAGDQADDASFDALRALRAAVALDLATRGATLAAIATFTSPRPVPADAWAQRIYRDPSRSAQLVGQVQPRHPLFMPTSFRALSS